MEIYNISALWKTVWRFLNKLNIEVSYDAEIPLLGVHPKEMKSVCQRNICTPMYINTVEYYSAFKKKEILSFSTMCIFEPGEYYAK
jgi:hypothetical protein